VPPVKSRRSTFSRGDVRLFALCALGTAASTALRYVSAGRIVPFVVSAIALALLASLVGRAVEALGDQLSAGATGIVQSALGNLPELFVSLFALRAGLYDVVRAAIVGSILANTLLVLGLAFVVGGLRHGTQRFGTDAANSICLMLVLAVGALVLPALTQTLHSPAAGHERTMSIIVSVLLLALFALSIPAAVRRAPDEAGAGHEKSAEWPLVTALIVLALAGLAAAVVSDQFVVALEPAIGALGISQAFAGLVIVAIAGNAVENVVGIQLAARNQADFALTLILQSPLQIALVLAPILVLAAPLIGASFTLVLSPLLIVVLVVAVLVTVVVVLDGESNWFEGSALLVLYGVIATAFWWG
jgi:Ca2+:H+ antiporter